MGFLILVEQNQTSVEHNKFILLYFVEQNQTMPVEQNHTMPVEQTSVTRQTKPLFCMSLAPDFQAAECLLNPYGEDDDDFETNLLIDTNIQSCYLYVDTVSASTHSQNPTTTIKAHGHQFYRHLNRLVKTHRLLKKIPTGLLAFQTSCPTRWRLCLTGPDRWRRRESF